ncbi:MAG: DUF4397 domain-containing protein [Firmicutes bacterium]|nr:DUF4397 domain-containing protein [Bacillota bacterium]
MRYPEKNELAGCKPVIKPDFEKAYLRFMHALPSDPPLNVDIYLNGKLVVKNLKFEDFTEYITVKAGAYTVQVFPTGNHLDQLVDMRIVLSDEEIATAAVIGTADEVEVEVFSDVQRPIDPDCAAMRFINLSPDSGGVNIYIDDTPVVYDLQFMEVTNYLSLLPGRHTMKVEIDSSKEIVVSHPNMVLKGGYFYTTYVVGLAYGRPYIEVLIPLEGTSYLTF